MIAAPASPKLVDAAERVSANRAPGLASSLPIVLKKPCPPGSIPVAPFIRPPVIPVITPALRASFKLPPDIKVPIPEPSAEP